MRFVPPGFLRHFQAAGWYEGRQQALPPGLAEPVASGHPAHLVLTSFGGLRIGEVGAGEDTASSDINFGRLSEIHSEDVTSWERLLDTTLIGVAEVHNGHSALYIARDERCFGLSFVHDAFYFEGESITAALEGILVGRRARPMLRPGQDSVDLYGETFTAASPELYRYAHEQK